MISKSFGDSATLQNQWGCLNAELNRLRNEGQCWEKLLLEKEAKIRELLDEIQRLQLALEAECQARQELENIIEQLKEQICTQDKFIGELTAVKNQLMACTKQLETEVAKCRSRLSGLEDERGEFPRMMRGYEVGRLKCSDLQKALAECCKFD